MSSTVPFLPAVPVTDSQRHVLVTAGVLAAHAAALWALQAGLLRSSDPIELPQLVMAEVLPAPAPAPRAQPQPAPVPAPPPKPVAPRPAPAPVPQVAPAPLPAPAPAPVLASPAPAPMAAPAAAPVAAAPAPAPAPAPVRAAAPAAPRIEQPSSDADYLHNPPPAYPSLSKRMGEQGKVIVRVLIGPDGNAQEATVAESSGFDRLDKAAVATVLKWRYVPGKRNGVPEAMWYRVPVKFELQE